ncbi:MAG: helix-turn-helix transcriptional regulator, partial [Hungatella sp.]|nr:helix-turn-helix transcriptional regulator [Hungatella sp.]
IKEISENNPKSKETYEQFEAECNLRRELANARKEQDITQKELCERTGLTQQAISRIEKDNDISPSLKNLIKYVNAIGYELTLSPKRSK